jgi:hypothetical protein
MTSNIRVLHSSYMENLFFVSNGQILHQLYVALLLMYHCAEFMF